MGDNAGKITVSQTMKALKTKSSSLYPMQFEKDKNEKYFPHTLCRSTLSSVIKISTGLQERSLLAIRKVSLISQAWWPVTGRGTDQDCSSVQSPAHPSLETQHQFSMENNVCSPRTGTFLASLVVRRQNLANETKMKGCWGLWEDFCFFWSSR